MPVLYDGTIMSNEELTSMYRKNLLSGKLPVAGYFCPICEHELLDLRSECKNCEKLKMKGEIKNA